MPEERHVVLAAYQGVSLLDLGGPLEAFRVASTFGQTRSRRAHYKCTVVSSHGGQVDTADGVPLVTRSIRSLDRAEIDTLIVPGAFTVEDVMFHINTADCRIALKSIRSGREPNARIVCAYCAYWSHLLGGMLPRASKG